MKTIPFCQLQGRLILTGSIVLFLVAIFTAGCDTIAHAQSSPAAGTSTAAFNKGLPGGTFTRSFEMNARVTAVDTANRQVTLQDSEGNEFTIKLGPEAVKFDKIQVGDLVKASVIEEVVVYLKTSAAALQGSSLMAFGYMETNRDEQAPDGSTGIVMIATNSAQPGGLITETTQATATVSAIDRVNRFATLRLEDGTTKTFHVRADVDLSRRKVGEKIVFRTTEMLAISVEKP